MVVNLYLVQHADARPKEEDPERHLSEAGWAAIRRMARFAAEHLNIQVARILHSGKTRAEETAAALAETLRPRNGHEATDGLDPMAEPRIWATRIAESADDLMLVGHLPHLGRLASLLLCGDEERPMVGFQKGGIVYIRTNEGGASIEWMVVPGIV